MIKILVVEDNAQNRYLMEYLLRKSGYAVVMASTGAEALSMAIREAPDLILMDIQLPDLDGLEVTRRLRASDMDKAVPIVAVTSFAMAGDRQKALEAGCTGYIEKPIDPEHLLKEIKIFCSACTEAVRSAREE